MTYRDRVLFWAGIAAMAAAAFFLATVGVHGQAMTAPGGQYRVEGGRAVLNPGWQAPTSQCGPNGCGPGDRCPLPRQPQWQTPQRPAAPVQQSRAHPAVCRIRNQVSGRASYLGSGTLIDKNQRHALVVTCYHLFAEGKGKVTCEFPGDGVKVFNAVVLTSDPAWDLSMLLISPPEAEPVNVAMQPPKPGDTVTSCGFGLDGQFAVNRGRVTGYVRTEKTATNETLELTGAARQGDSGGPVFNAKGELAAVLWGTDGRTVGGTYCGRVDQFLLTAGRYLLPWNAKINDPARDPRLQPPVPLPQQQPPQVIVQPPAQGPPPQDLGPIQQAISDLSRRQTDLEARQDKVRDTATDLAKKYEDKLPGISKDLEAAIAQSKSAADEAKGAKAEVATALDEDNPKGLFGRVKARLEDRFGGVLSEMPLLRYGLIGLAVGLGYLFLRREGAKAAAGEPTAWQRAAALTPTDIDDKIAAKVAAGQAALHEKIAELRGHVIGQKQPPT